VTTWVTTIVGVIVLYLLTFPIVLTLEFKRTLPGSSIHTFSQSWVFWYGMPYFLLSSVPPLEDPMRKYMQWWMERLIAGGGMHMRLGPSPP
jgi:hypothetical protein